VGVVAVDIVVVITTSHCVFHYSTVVVVELACRYVVSLYGGLKFVQKWGTFVFAHDWMSKGLFFQVVLQDKISIKN